MGRGVLQIPPVRVCLFVKWTRVLPNFVPMECTTRMALVKPAASLATSDRMRPTEAA